MKKIAPSAFAALFFMVIAVGFAFAAPNRQNPAPESQPSETAYAMFIAEKERQLALARTAQEKRLAIAVIPDVPRVSIRGTVVMPDGSPIPHDGFFLVNLNTARFAFNKITSPDGVKFMSKQSVFSSSGSSNVGLKKNGTFQFGNAAEVGTNAIVSIVNNGSPKNTHKQYLSKPIAFVVHPSMKPLEIKLEKGIPVCGQITYNNGTPAANSELCFEQRIMPALGAEIPAMQDMLKTSRWVRADVEGKYEVFLLPGDYIVTDRSEERTLIIDDLDTEQTLHWKMLTPIFIEIKKPDNSLADEIMYVTIADESSGTYKSGIQKGTFIIKTASYNRLYVVDKKFEQGTHEIITQEMIGMTVPFTLKPICKLVIKLIDEQGNPVANKRVGLQVRTIGNESRSSAIVDDVQTDSQGNAVLRVAPGQFPITITLPGSFEEPTPADKRIKRINREIEKELDLAPGETLDLGTVRITVD